MENNILKKYIEEHNKRIEEHGMNVKGLWKGEGSQQIRFRAFLPLFISKEDISIIDIGCGFADFYTFLKNNGFNNIDYTGYEINEAIAVEARKRNPDCNIITDTITQENLKDRNFDYAIASGIYNLGESRENSMQFFFEQFDLLWDKINIGFACNFLSEYSSNKDDTSVYHSPGLLLDKVMNRYNKYAILKHDYLPHDFSIIVYKNQIDK